MATQCSLDDLLRDDGAVYGTFFGEEAVLHYGDWKAEHAQLADGVGLVDLRNRTLLELTGNDRAAFLNHLTTNKTVGLMPGAGCETFLTDGKARALAHLYVFARSDSLVLETVADESKKIMDHLDYYRIREDVAFHDRSAACCEFLLAGQQTERLLEDLTSVRLPAGRLDGVEVRLAGHLAEVRRVDMVGPPAFLLIFAAGAAGDVWNALREAGAQPCGRQAAEAARIEAGWPAYGRDISAANLVQEVDRDERAISFTKGCYLGQETVARIESRGHVNQTLVGLRCDTAEIPCPGGELTAAEKVVGRVTSATFSPRLGSALALGYVHRPENRPGVRLQSAAGPVEVIGLPL